MDIVKIYAVTPALAYHIHNTVYNRERSVLLMLYLGVFSEKHASLSHR